MFDTISISGSTNSSGDINSTSGYSFGNIEQVTYSSGDNMHTSNDCVINPIIDSSDKSACLGVFPVSKSINWEGLNWWCVTYTDGEHKKKPFNPITGHLAKPNDERTFASHKDCSSYVRAGKYDAIGVRLGRIDPDYVLACFDLDAKNQDAEKFEEIKRDILSVGGYAEYSMSGNGIHVFFLINERSMPQDYRKVYKNKSAEYGLEFYAGCDSIEGASRYIAVTNNHIEGKSIIIEDSLGCISVLEKYMKRDVRQVKAKQAKAEASAEQHKPAVEVDVQKVIENCKNHVVYGARFSELFDSFPVDSEDKSKRDFALCCVTVMMIGNNLKLVEEVVRQSNRAREKWNRKGKTPYLPSCIEAAASVVGTSESVLPDKVISNVTINERYIDSHLIKEGQVNIISAAMGTGKTQAVNKYWKDMSKYYMEIHGTRLTMLSVAPLVSVVKTNSNLYGIDCYDDENVARVINDSCALCINSLTRVQKGYIPDVLQIDECSSLLNRLTTLKNSDIAGAREANPNGGKVELLSKLFYLIKHAKTVIITDADIENWHIEWIKQIRGDVNVIVNEYQTHKEYKMYESKGAVLDIIDASLKEDKKVVVNCNHRNECKAIARLFSFKFPCKTIKVFSSETSATDEHKSFFENADKYIAKSKPDLIVLSPSCTSNVSITAGIDVVCAINFADTTRPQDQIQAMGRCRNVEVIHQWNDSRRIQSQENHWRDRCMSVEKRMPLLTLKHDKLYENLVDSVYISDEKINGVVFSRAVEIMAKGKGYTVTHVKSDKSNGSEDDLKATKTMMAEERVSAIINSKIDDPVAIRELAASGDDKTPEQAIQIERLHLEEFYGEIDHEVVSADNEGKLRFKIKQLTDTLLPDETIELRQFRTNLSLAADVVDYKGKNEITKLLMSLIGYDVVSEKCDSWDKVRAAEILAEILNHQNSYELVNKAIRDEAARNPCKALGMILDSFGLKTKSSKVGAKGNQIRSYTVDFDSANLRNIRLRVKTIQKRGIGQTKDDYLLSAVKSLYGDFESMVKSKVGKAVMSLMESGNMPALA